MEGGRWRSLAELGSMAGRAGLGLGRSVWVSLDGKVQGMSFGFGGFARVLIVLCI